MISKSTEVPAVFSPEEAGTLLGMSAQTVRRQINEGSFTFPAQRSGRVYLIPSRPILEFLGMDAPAAS